MSSRVLNGMVFCCTGLDVEVRMRIQSMVEKHGGEWSRNMTGRVTHLLAQTSYGSEKFQMATKLRIPAIHPDWINDIDSGKINTMEKHRVKVLTGTTICVTKLGVGARESIRELVLVNGGKYSPELTRTVTHLITDPKSTEQDGPKIEYAKTWNIPIVDVSWIHETIQQGYLGTPRLDQEQSVFTGIKFEYADLSSEDQHRIVQTLQKNGYSDPLHPDRICIISPWIADCASNNRVTEYWLVKCIETKTLCSVEDSAFFTPKTRYDPDSRMADVLRKKVTMSMTGLDSVERMYFEKYLEIGDISVSPYFSRKMDALLCSTRINLGDSAKFVSSSKWGIPAIRIEWIFEHLQGNNPDLSRYVMNGIDCLALARTLSGDVSVVNQGERLRIKNLFSGMFFCVSQKLLDRREELTSLIRENGGRLTWNFDMGCTHFIHSSTKVDERFREFKLARIGKKPIVSHWWLIKSKEAGKILNPDMFPHVFDPFTTLDFEFPEQNISPHEWICSEETRDVLSQLENAISQSRDLGARGSKSILFSSIRDNQKQRLRSMVEELGSAECLVSDCWDDQCTHLIAGNPSKSEKYLAAMASSRWILKEQYILDSHKAGHWLGELEYVWKPEDVEKVFGCRLLRSDKGFPFKSWNVLLDRTLTKGEGLMRVLRAGGARAEFLDVDRAGKENRGFFEKITHVFIEDDDTNTENISELAGKVYQTDHIVDVLTGNFHEADKRSH